MYWFLQTAAAAVLKGVITDPRDLSPEIAYPSVKDPEKYSMDEDSIIIPPTDSKNIEVDIPRYCFHLHLLL